MCLPFAGGAAGYFRHLSAALTPDVEVLAVQYPGRQDRRGEPVITDLRALADEVFVALRPLVDAPIALFGHSMGASVGFEVVRRFEEHGLPSPLALLVSARGAPSLPARRKVHGLDDDGIVAELTALGGTDPAVLADPELRAMVMPALRGDYQAAEGYQAPTEGAVVDVPIVALAGDSDPRVSVDDVAAWQDHTRGAFRMEVFPGGHFYLSDCVPDVAAQIRSVLLSR
ncbi:thioesterase II family protein [Streptomyces sp. NBC_01217]|uniref:thioesterase II family protein n=1 Tax=Streptomyces sp. NBC_01217 TaxID=2903779 RepID=UPI002E0EAE05|nr:alpha/beta fold hydrolase [Streptomyces sp. NBC_01217]